jgi:tetratricopeptide (TPR) repeat protein
MRSATPIVLALAFALAGARLLAQISAEAQQHAEKAVQLAQQGDLKNAESELRKAVELAPDDANLLTSLGGILGMEGNLQEANTYLARAVRLHPQDPASRRNLAANEWQLGRLKEARANLDLLLRANPRDKLAMYLSGMVSEKEKDYARSAELLESVPDVMAQQPDSWVALASSYYHTGRTENARAALQHLLSPPSTARSAFLGGTIAAEAQDYATAEMLFRSVRSSYPDRAAVELEIALAEYQAGHKDESEKTLLAAVNANQATSETYVLLCTMLSDKGLNIPALQFATRAAQAFPESSEVLSVKGSIELKLKYFSEAVATYERATRLSDSAGVKRGLATAQWQAGMPERAAATFDEAIRQFPRDARTYQVYGTLLLDDGSPQNKGRAIDLFKHALALNDSAVEPRYQLANLELENGNPQQALAYLERAIQLDPKDSRLHFALSRVYRRLSRDADARRETEIYLKLKAVELPGKQNDSAGGTQP